MRPKTYVSHVIKRVIPFSKLPVNHAYQARIADQHVMGAIVTVGEYPFGIYLANLA